MCGWYSRYGIATTERCAGSSGQWKNGSEGVDMEVQVSGGDSLTIASWSMTLMVTYVSKGDAG